MSIRALVILQKMPSPEKISVLQDLVVLRDTYRKTSPLDRTSTPSSCIISSLSKPSALTSLCFTTMV